MSVGPWIDAKVNQPPLDGKPKLLMVRLHPDVPTISPVSLLQNCWAPRVGDIG
jgi:hypothetical protein